MDSRGVVLLVRESDSNGVVIAVTNGERGVLVNPLLVELRAWADSARAVLARTTTTAPDETVTFRSPEVVGAGGSMQMARSIDQAGARVVVSLAGRYGVQSASYTMTDSSGAAFVSAVRAAADSVIARAGDGCAAEIAATIARRGQPLTREREGGGGAKLYERLTYRRLMSTRTVAFVWGGGQPGCETREF